MKKRDEDSVVGLTRNNIGVLCDIDYMSEPKLFIPALLGTPRKNRESGDVAKWVCGKMREREEIETQLFDVCDFDLPDGNGLQFLAWLRWERRDHGPFLLISGSSNFDGDHPSDFAFLAKPFRMEELRSRLDELTANKPQSR